MGQDWTDSNSVGDKRETKVLVMLVFLEENPKPKTFSLIYSQHTYPQSIHVFILVLCWESLMNKDYL